jgi:hypothetical protein
VDARDKRKRNDDTVAGMTIAMDHQQKEWPGRARQ